MKKAGIITLFGEFNFGNRLQNYAVQEILKKHGMEVETIKHLGPNYDIAKKDTEAQRERLKKFKKFNENIKFSEYEMYKGEEVPKELMLFDYVFIGSDQVWNYNYGNVFSDKAFASFVAPEKRVSISASMGVSELPEKNSENYKLFETYLKDMKKVSVREEAAKDLIEKLVNRNDIELLVDPTMFLSAKEWEQVMMEPKNVTTSKYMVKCFLGADQDNAIRKANEYAENCGLEIIDISNPNSPHFDMGPAEFLHVIKNAEFILTNSFHGTVFSILFNTPFAVIEKEDKEGESMHSRIETLLSKFSFENQLVSGEIDKAIFEMDFSKVEDVLKIEREKADKFVKEAIENE